MIKIRLVLLWLILLGFFITSFAVEDSTTEFVQQVFPLPGQTQADLKTQYELSPMVRAAANGVFTKRLQKECLDDVYITDTVLTTDINKFAIDSETGTLKTSGPWQEEWEVKGCNQAAWFIILFKNDNDEIVYQIQLKK